MENKGANFDTFPGGFMLRRRIDKGRVRDPPGPAIGLRIETFDQGDQVWGLSIPVVPLDIRIRLDRTCLPNPIRVYELDGEDIAVGYGMRVRDCQGALQYGFNGPPDVDNLISPLEKFRCILGEMIQDALLGRVVGLVDMDTLHRSSPLGLGNTIILGLSPDSVIENKHSRSTGSGESPN